MNLLEYQAKHLLSEYAIATPDGQLVDKTTKHSLNYPVILKSQVPVGGRGKLGGIKRISSDSELRTAITTLSNHKIKGHTPTALLAEQALSIQKEYYLAFLVDRTSQTIQLVAHKEGGMDVESQQDFQKWTIPYAALDADTLGQSLAEHYDLPGQTFALQVIPLFYRK
jgi:succinyl-CoA synthetase beta subunit